VSIFFRFCHGMNKVHLAVEVIRDHLGTPPWQVASLLVRGKRTLPALLRESEMPYDRLRKALLQLIQHNCLTVIREGPDPDKDTYEVDVHATLMRLRFPAIIRQARETFGDDGALVASEILEKGRLTRGELLEILRRRFPSAEKATYGDTLAKMIAGHWVHRVPELAGPERAEKKDTANVLSSVGARGPPKRKPQAAAKGATAVGGLEDLLAAVSELDAPTVPTEPDGDAEDDEAESSAKRQRVSDDSRPKPRLKKSRKPALPEEPLIMDEEEPEATDEAAKGADQATSSAADNSTALPYRINYCQFLLAFRNAEIKRFVSVKYKDVAARIVQFMLDAGQRLNERHTVVSLPQVTAPIARSSLCEALDSSIERIETHLGLLIKGQVLTQHAAKRDKEYIVNVQQVTQILRQRAACNAVYTKFGPLGARVLRIILDKKLVEDKQVQEIAMAPQKEVRQVVMDMYKSGYLQLQEVPRSSERKPSESIYLWGVDFSKLQTTLLDVHYKTIRNLRARLALERRRVSDSPETNPIERKKMEERLSILEDRFRASIVDLDHAIMIFQNF